MSAPEPARRSLARAREGAATSRTRTSARAGAARRAGDESELEGWTRCGARGRDGVELWTRPAPASAGARAGVREVMAMCSFDDVDRRALWEAICDLDRYAEFVPYVRSSRVVATRGRRTWNHATVRAPVAGDRDYTIEIEDLSDPRVGLNAGRWKTTREHEPEVPPGRARMRCNCGSWELRDDPSGRGVRVRYTLITDPGKGVPGWLLSQTPRTVPDVLRAFHERARSKKSARRDVARNPLDTARENLARCLARFTADSKSFLRDAAATITR